MLATKANLLIKYFFWMTVNEPIVIAYPNYKRKIYVDLCY